MDWKEEREKLQKEFAQRTMDAVDRSLLKEKLEKGTASYADALKYAQLTGQEAGGLLAEEIVTLYPDRILSAEDARQLIAPVMRDNHELVTGATNAVQKQMNERAGLGLNAVVPEYNSSYENGVIYEAAAPDKTESYFEKAFRQKIENMSMATVDDALRANADFQAKCGIRKYIKRVPNGSCCAWCSALAGTYDYEDVSGTGNDVWRRHKNCDCIIDFIEDGKPQRVYNYREANTPEGRAAIERRKQVGVDDLERRQLASMSITNLRNEWVGKSVNAKFQNYDIMDLATGKKYHLAEDTHLQDKEVFAGKGTRVPYRKAYKYANRWGGNIEDWQHVKGYGTLTTPDGDRKAEIHWSQCEGIGKKDLNIKRWLD